MMATWIFNSATDCFVNYTLVAGCTIFSQLMVLIFHDKHLTLYYLANFLMAVHISNLATDWLFTVSKSLAQPVIGCLLSYSGWQNLQPSQNCLPKLNLAGNQDTILFLTLNAGDVEP